MRTLRSVARLLVICTGLGWLSAGCHNKTTDAAPQGNCRVQRVFTTGNRLGSTATTETIYKYDVVGNLAKKAQTSAYQYLAGGGDNTTTTETYTYNADGFLTLYDFLIVQQNVDFTGKVSNYKYTWNKAYTYTDNRVTGYTRKDISYNQGIMSSPQQQTITIMGLYEYDAAGQLVKETINNGATWTYRNGQLLEYTEKNGTTESHPYTIQNGLIIQARFNGTKGVTNGPDIPYNLTQIREYDDQRRLTKHQEFRNDTLDSYYTQEWQTEKPATLTVPALKGHPVLKLPYGESGVMTRYRTYYVNHLKADSVYSFNDITYTNQLNAQGFVTNTNAETRYFTNGQTQPDVSTTVYTYTGCN